jgi:cytochrome oxidase Cu insertion factor (SCO1/SenC/PrrC family)
MLEYVIDEYARSSSGMPRYETMMKLSAGVSIVTVAISCLAALVACGARDRPQKVTGLVGTVLEQPSQAADFTLTDQHGWPFQMAKTRGKVVLMAFLQTQGGDAQAQRVKIVHDLLGADVEHVVFVAVTLDPKGDTTEVAAEFSEKLGLLDAWHFLGGWPEDVKAVWFDYGVAVSADPETPFGAYDKEYFAPLFLLDKRGFIRDLMDSDMSAAEIAKNIRVLLALN